MSDKIHIYCEGGAVSTCVDEHFPDSTDNVDRFLIGSMYNPCHETLGCDHSPNMYFCFIKVHDEDYVHDFVHNSHENGQIKLIAGSGWRCYECIKTYFPEPDKIKGLIVEFRLKLI